MHCCRWLWHFFMKFKNALYIGLREYGRNGCISGIQYLVKPNYHPCERCLWLVIFLVGYCIGFTLIFNYMKDFSQNTFRVVDEEHSPHEPLRYPSLGICQTGEENDYEVLKRVDQILKRSLYREFPELATTDYLKNIVHMLTFQNLYDKNKLDQFSEFLATLPQSTQKYVANYEFRNVTEEIAYDCDEFFIECLWLETPFNCCSVFLPVPTVFGNCFLFNSRQTEDKLARKMLSQIEIYKEPYNLVVRFTKAAQVFIQNAHDIPQNLFFTNNFAVKEKGTILYLGFVIYTTLIEESLLELDSDTLGCVASYEIDRLERADKIYAFQSYSACITENFFQQQASNCKCINVNGPRLGQNFCHLSQFRCLEQYGFLNTKTMPFGVNEHKRQCPTYCSGSIYGISDKKTTEVNRQNDRTLEFYLEYFPTYHCKRQAIRQSEDKLSAFSNILGLFMGLNAINIIEWIYLTWCALWK